MKEFLIKVVVELMVVTSTMSFLLLVFADVFVERLKDDNEKI
tara:strand:- start:202 stop:327 length:126 start_codon:yes stop_codon:yes gene_type:complete